MKWQGASKPGHCSINFQEDSDPNKGVMGSSVWSNNAAFAAPWADVCMCQRGRHRVIPDAPDGWAGRENDGTRNSRGQVSII